MKVFLDSVGCRLNQSELELMASDLRLGGAQLVGSPELGEAIVLNTCAVTQDAAADSRKLARRMRRRNPHARLILTGCWVTLDPGAARRIATQAEVVPNAQKQVIASLVLGDRPRPPAAGGEGARSPIPGRRHRVRGFVKAQEGCSATCAFCLTRLVRGPARSVPAPVVVQRVQQSIAGGAREIVLCGVQLGAYGKDLGEHASLESLVTLILSETQGARLRLSSLEPWDLSNAFLALWQDERLCLQLHLPLQSGSRATLERMQRPITPAEFACLAASARAAIPDVALTTDLMAGFPGECEAEFSESLRFIEAIGFEGAHVFGYSPRPGTLAAKMPGQIDPPEVRRRVRALRSLASRARQGALAAQVGGVAEAVWVSAQPAEGEGWQLRGLSSTGFEVSVWSLRNLRGQCSQVRITGVRGSQLEAALLSNDRAAPAPLH